MQLKFQTKTMEKDFLSYPPLTLRFGFLFSASRGEWISSTSFPSPIFPPPALLCNFLTLLHISSFSPASPHFRPGVLTSFSLNLFFRGAARGQGGAAPAEADTHPRQLMTLGRLPAGWRRWDLPSDVAGLNQHWGRRVALWRSSHCRGKSESDISDSTLAASAAHTLPLLSISSACAAGYKGNRSGNYESGFTLPSSPSNVQGWRRGGGVTKDGDDCFAGYF